jgi:hypothetical protein
MRHVFGENIFWKIFGALKDYRSLSERNRGNKSSKPNGVNPKSGRSLIVSFYIILYHFVYFSLFTSESFFLLLWLFEQFRKPRKPQRIFAEHFDINQLCLLPSYDSKYKILFAFKNRRPFISLIDKFNNTLQDITNQILIQPVQKTPFTTRISFLNNTHLNESPKFFKHFEYHKKIVYIHFNQMWIWTYHSNQSNTNNNNNNNVNIRTLKNTELHCDLRCEFLITIPILSSQITIFGVNEREGLFCFGDIESLYICDILSGDFVSTIHLQKRLNGIAIFLHLFQSFNRSVSLFSLNFVFIFRK